MNLTAAKYGWLDSPQVSNIVLLVNPSLLRVMTSIVVSRLMFLSRTRWTRFLCLNARDCSSSSTSTRPKALPTTAWVLRKPGRTTSRCRVMRRDLEGMITSCWTASIIPSTCLGMTGATIFRYALCATHGVARTHILPGLHPYSHRYRARKKIDYI